MERDSTQILQIIFRIACTVFCVYKAGELNRSKWGWGIFAFIFTFIPAVILLFLKPITVWEGQEEGSGQNDNDASIH